MLASRLNLDPGETILLEVRRHWFVFLARSVAIFFMAFVPGVLLFGAIELLPSQFAAFVEARPAVIVFIYSLWLLFCWMFFFIQWTTYYLDVWYITESRIIDVEQKGLFRREVSNLRFDKIQDISVEVRGIIPTFLDFGDLNVQTAAEDSTGFFMKNAAHPDEVRKLIFSRHNREAEKLHRTANGGLSPYDQTGI